MSLPPALLARLQKRGIVRQEEEVIAENYEPDSSRKKVIDDNNGAGAPGCPNKYNIYHICLKYCFEHWKNGTPEERLSESYLRKKQRMLMKYPLPEGWIEVYDAGVARFYYWNTDTNEVCWLSPRHPRAVIGEAAPKIARDLLERSRSSTSSRHETRHEETSRRHDDRRDRDRDRDRRDRDRDDGRRQQREKRRRQDSGGDEDLSEMNDRDRLRRAKRKGIDPMDPAAYGDAPVGKWADGLTADSKSGADVTAGGPLFQQRPYPAPGAILRRQQQDDDDED